ncbi:HAD-IIA family hydrolase [Methylomonas sp. SURF-2]|uniref:HAD-IIA family hydrolase n=1 Tax=Methylomonas subterranea TaxID=2952225 RepID=A0ABT1TJL4_9GAMM|nr:HAD-IIA family hydrolase [Methylomonas sp. SURF-2]MCQ8105257.1 HAD-IIA family hydrolase [Methylomonas sp. SURF-2]
MQVFTDIGGLIIDMDGVLWHGDQALPGLEAFFATLRELQLPFVLATNNASITAEQYVGKLSAMRVEIGRREILTSGMATALYLSERYPASHTRVYAIGGAGLRQPLRDKGFVLLEEHDPGPADLVVSGLDKTLNWDKLCNAALHIQAGAGFYGSNGDVTLPSERGFLPGNGATLAALTAATGVMPITIGKPAPIIYQQALALLGQAPERVIAIGDRLDTDILGAVRTGIRSVLVLSGISREEDIPRLDYAPTWVMRDIRELTEALRR